MSHPASSSPAPALSASGLWFRRLLIAGLVAYALLIHGNGLRLASQPGKAGDTQARWQQVQYVLRGIDPNGLVDRVDGREQAFFAGRLEGPGLRFYPQLVIPQRLMPYGDYPPSSYFTGIFLHWPQTLTAAGWWYRLVNVAALITLVIGVWRTLREMAPAAAGIGTAAAAAIAGYHTNWAVGNYSLIVTALLVLTWRALRADRPAWAGLWLGLSLIKPTSTLPFLLILMARRRTWPTAAVAVGYNLLGAAMVGWWTQTPPWAMALRAYQHIAPVAHLGGGSVRALRGMGLSNDWGLPLGAVAAGGAALLVVRRMGRDTLLLQLAIAGVVARLWTYHRHYDNALLTFLLLLLAVGAWHHRSRRCLALFLITGLSLWLPFRWVGDARVSLAFEALWLVLLVMSVWTWVKLQRRPSATPPTTQKGRVMKKALTVAARSDNDATRSRTEPVQGAGDAPPSPG